jgi:hypothetical protein
MYLVNRVFFLVKLIFKRHLISPVIVLPFGYFQKVGWHHQPIKAGFPCPTIAILGSACQKIRSLNLAKDLPKNLYPLLLGLQIILGIHIPPAADQMLAPCVVQHQNPWKAFTFLVVKV